MVCSKLRIECRKERKAVFDDRATDVGTGIEFRIPVRSKSGKRKIFGRTNKTLRQAVRENIAVIVIAARLGDHVENTAGGQSLISTKSTGLDLDLLNEFERQIC